VQLPYAQHAIVSPFKVRDYLLSFQHPIGRAKATFFARLGFSREHWGELQRALWLLAQEGEAEALPSGPFGQKYRVRGIIEGPTGRVASVTSIWVVPRGETVPRFVTAYRGDSS
jgi:hypothetical protein